MNGLQTSISAVAVHPTQPILAIAGSTGFVLLWDYLKKEYIMHQYEFYEKEQPTTMMFTPDGDELLIGNSNGTISVLEPDKQLQKKQSQQPLKTTENKISPITYLTISKDGLFFATMDTNCCVCLFKKSQMDEKKPIEW